MKITSIMNNKNKESKPIKIGEKSFEEVSRFIQEIISDPNVWGREESLKRQKMLEKAQAGDINSIEETKYIISKIIDQYGLKVEGMTSEDLCYKIYSKIWGLDVLEELYHDGSIDEIRVNSPDKVFIQKRGKNYKSNIKFKDEDHVKRILSRLFVHDRGVALTTSTPAIESIREDGTRVTATCSPVTGNSTFVLRKHGTFKMTKENLIKAGTLNEEILNLLEKLVRGRVNIMISGGTGTGKTSLLRYLVGYMDNSVRLITLETDKELRLTEYYPERDIVEFEEHPEIGLDMNKLFRTILRYSPDVIIVGEIRGKGEATEAIKACVRGHDGSMATIHFNSPVEAIEGCAKMMVEEGLNLPLDLASHWVASAFNVVVQMFTDTKKGIKKITKVTEVTISDGEIKYRDLVEWIPSKEDFFKGEWKKRNDLSPYLIEKMQRYTTV